MVFLLFFFFLLNIKALVQSNYKIWFAFYYIVAFQDKVTRNLRWAFNYNCLEGC